MIQSMTGYGRAETMIGGRKAVVEIRSLNGKSIDINVKSYLVPRDKELWLRKFLAEKLVRGSVDFYLSYPSDDDTPSRSLNLPLAEAYFSQILGSMTGKKVSASSTVVCTCVM